MTEIFGRKQPKNEWKSLYLARLESDEGLDGQKQSRKAGKSPLNKVGKSKSVIYRRPARQSSTSSEFQRIRKRSSSTEKKETESSSGSSELRRNHRRGTAPTRVKSKELIEQKSREWRKEKEIEEKLQGKQKEESEETPQLEDHDVPQKKKKERT